MLYNKTDNNSHIISQAELSQFIKYINQKNILKGVTASKLFEWKLIEKRFNDIYATNGYMLLTSNPFSYSYVKLGLFEGLNKTKLITEEIFSGSIIEQYENAKSRVVEILYKGFELIAVRRKEYLVPEVVIREIIANAIIHRNYNDEHPVRIEIFSDRISIFTWCLV